MEHDTMGQVAVPADKLWGAQTQRSFENFPIGEEKMPADLITAFGVLKEACAAANHKLGKLDDTRYALIQSACQAIRAGELADHFPLAVWQTGSGTQTNMNSNEVIARYGDAFHPKKENWEPLRGEIEFRDVTFRYPDGTPTEASIEGVRPTGELLLRHADGTLREYLFKEIEFVIAGK